MNLPKKRLGRGLEGLISGGVTATAVAMPVATPVVKVDAMRVADRAPVAQNAPQAKLAEDLHVLLERTQAETDGTTTSTTEGLETLPLKAIHTSPYQRRKEFSAEAISELAASIRAEGLLQPIVVRKAAQGYELIAGERRLRACKSLGLEKIPARIIEAPDATAAVMGLIENLQRENLNPVEEARGYGMLLGDFHMTQEQIAERTGKARASVANSLRLLLLEPEILGYLAKGQLSVGHAKVLLGLPESPERVLLARKVIAEGFSVRQTESLLRKTNILGRKGSLTHRAASEEELAVVHDLEKRLQGYLNTKVSLTHSAKGGRMTVYYKSNAELEALLKRMGV
jgi:ParB family transcriptional regulator, chromosome partitioning protein